MCPVCVCVSTEFCRMGALQGASYVVLLCGLHLSDRVLYYCCRNVLRPYRTCMSQSLSCGDPHHDANTRNRHPPVTTLLSIIGSIFPNFRDHHCCPSFRQVRACLETSSVVVVGCLSPLVHKRSVLLYNKSNGPEQPPSYTHCKNNIVSFYCHPLLEYHSILL